MCSCEESGKVLPNNARQLQSGFLLHYKAKWFGSDWSRVFCVIYQDSTLVWYENQMASRPEGTICLKLAPELIARGQYTSRLFRVPDLPSDGSGADYLIAIGERRRQRVHFFLAESDQDINSWWTAIVSTLPVAAAPNAPPSTTMQPVPTQPIVDGMYGYRPNQSFGPGGYPQPVVQTQYLQPVAASQPTTVVVRDSGPSFGGAAGGAVVGLAAGAVMGAALSDLARPNYHGGGYGGFGGGYQDNDVTVINNYNVDYNMEQNFSNVQESNDDWGGGGNDDFDAGYDF